MSDFDWSMVTFKVTKGAEVSIDWHCANCDVCIICLNAVEHAYVLSYGDFGCSVKEKVVEHHEEYHSNLTVKSANKH